MKKIDKLISTSFIGPAILSYFVATFVLVMQFLWKYIDDILGKGMSIFEMLELIFYYAVTLIPMAVPITVLISSVMVFGDMAEKYELSSMKSAGISLIRIMMPALVIASAIGLLSIFSANYLKPASLLQFNKRFISIRKQKAALSIEEGIFNNAFNETIIRVDKIEDNKKDIHQVLIYDHNANDKSLISVMTSKSGQMYTTPDGRLFIMKLDTGVHYRESEQRTQLGSSKTEIPFMRTYFDEWIKSFNMTQFDENEGLLNFNRKKEDMMNTIQLMKAIDSFRNDLHTVTEKLDSKVGRMFTVNTKDIALSEVDEPLTPNQDQTNNATNSTTPVAHRTPLSGLQYRDSVINYQLQQTAAQNMLNDTTSQSSENAIQTDTASSTKTVVTRKVVALKNMASGSTNHFSELIDSVDYRNILINATSELTRDRDEILMFNTTKLDNSHLYQKYMLRLNQQYSWALICIVFLFIGAPLGSIIRKGGYGYPLLVAIFFYMIFIISLIYGEKLVNNDSMTGLVAAWLPCIILSPFAAILTYSALRDLKLNTAAILEYYYRYFKKSKA